MGFPVSSTTSSPGPTPSNSRHGRAFSESMSVPSLPCPTRYRPTRIGLCLCTPLARVGHPTIGFQSRSNPNSSKSRTLAVANSVTPWCWNVRTSRASIVRRNADGVATAGVHAMGQGRPSNQFADPCDIAAITSSTLNFAGFWRGGKAARVSRNSLTITWLGTSV